MNLKNKRIDLNKKPVHFLDDENYYLCNRAVGNKLKGLGTKNIRLVTCMNCLKNYYKMKEVFE